MKSCPFCAEQIQDAAIKCRFCGSNLLSEASNKQVGARELSPSSVRSCPFCSSQIPPTATICPSCGDDVTYGAKSEPTPEEVSAAKPQNRSQKASTSGFVIAITLVGAIILVGSILSTIKDRSSQPSNPNSPEISAPSSATAARPVLELKSKEWSWRQIYSHIQVDGQVKNISDTSLKNVSVVALFYDKDGSFITSESALIDYNPILRGQVSPFRVIGTWNPAIRRVDIQFKELMGGKLEHISVSK